MVVLFSLSDGIILLLQRVSPRLTKEGKQTGLCFGVHKVCTCDALCRRSTLSNNARRGTGTGTRGASKLPGQMQNASGLATNLQFHMHFAHRFKQA